MSTLTLAFFVKMTFQNRPMPENLTTEKAVNDYFKKVLADAIEEQECYKYMCVYCDYPELCEYMKWDKENNPYIKKEPERVAENKVCEVIEIKKSEVKSRDDLVLCEIKYNTGRKTYFQKYKIEKTCELYQKIIDAEEYWEEDGQYFI